MSMINTEVSDFSVQAYVDDTFKEITKAQLLGKWNVFSYTFRNIEDNGDLNWICGKMICVCLILLMGVMLPEIIKKRG